MDVARLHGVPGLGAVAVGLLYTRRTLGTAPWVLTQVCRHLFLGFRGWQGEAMLWRVGLLSVTPRRRSVFWCRVVAALAVSVGVFSGIVVPVVFGNLETASQSTVNDIVRRRVCLEGS